MNLIANVNESWGIGKNGDLLCKIPQDMSFFKFNTIGKTIIYGRKTLDSFPGGKPLPFRKNIVITGELSHVKPEIQHSVNYFGSIHKLIVPRKNGESIDLNAYMMAFRDQISDDHDKYEKFKDNTSLFVVKSVKEAIILSNILELKSENVFVCGGESIYKQFLPFCEYAYLTINNCKEEADTFFPNLNEFNNWDRMVDGAEGSYGDITYRTGVLYVNRDISNKKN